MAPPVSRLTDTGSGHNSFPSTVVISASSNTSVNSLLVARHGDALEPHGSPSPSPKHDRAICGHSEKTTVNSKGAARIGDAICCGGLLVTGSGNTVFG